MDYILKYRKPEDTEGIDLPGSKSITNRALLINAMSETEARLEGLAQCDDTYAIIDALRKAELGHIDVGAAGTAMRFLTAYFAAMPSISLTITGSDRMLNRPIAPLVEALRNIGAKIDYISEEGFPPLRIEGRNLKGGHIGVRSDISSQFISALMIIGPTLQRGLTIHLLEDTVSKTYIEMTCQIMRKFGINAHYNNETIKIPRQSYLPPMSFDIEADWSAASYFYEMVALSDIDKLKLKGLQPPGKSLQGDSFLSEIYSLFGVQTSFYDNYVLIQKSDDSPKSDTPLDFNLTCCPDLVPTLAVTACLSNRQFHFKGISNLRIKECDRLHALVVELRGLGYFLRCDADSISWEGEKCQPNLRPIIKTYKDHRIAMAFAPAATKIDNLVIQDAEVVRKSFPQFWNEMRKVGINTSLY